MKLNIKISFHICEYVIISYEAKLLLNYYIFSVSKNIPI